LDQLVKAVADALAAHDWETSRHTEPFDFYESMAEVAIKTVRENS